MEKDYQERLYNLRKLMIGRGLDIVIITGSDPHNSEYVAPRWKGVEWLSGFSGEGGAVVTLYEAGVWTDSRYFIQAEKQLKGGEFVMYKTRTPDSISIPEWIHNYVLTSDKSNIAIGVDGLATSQYIVEEINLIFSSDNRISDEERDIKIINIPDFLDLIWDDRPQIPVSPIISLGDELTGENTESKIFWLRSFLYDNNYDGILLSAPDEIAWMLNIRGEDIECNPVVISYLLVTKDHVIWYVLKHQLSKYDEESLDSFKELSKNNVKIKGYDDIEIDLSDIIKDMENPLLLDSKTLNYSLFNMLNLESSGYKLGISPVGLRKSIKNETEIEGMKDAHYEDGLVMERFIYWLEHMVEIGDGLDEYMAAQKLGELRAQVAGYRGDSFETISAYGENAALPHYVTPSYNSKQIYNSGLYLCDSGGQYLYGTTDLTRTIPLGTCSNREKEDYTLVLKGHIDLAMAVFPMGTSGCHLDILARNPLWQRERNFGHGTGHGVGCFLNVHEGPQDIRQNYNNQPLMPGMITSDEPGIYIKGNYGIRHENLLLCKKAGTNEFGTWLKFEVLTLCHFDTSIIEKSLLTEEEIAWLNTYNENVYQQLSPNLPHDIVKWLRQKTAPI